MASQSWLKRLSLSLALVTAVALVALVVWLRDDPNRPRFVPLRSASISGPLQSLSYEFLSPRPFEGGKMWITVTSGSEHHVYLFDIERRAVVGELMQGNPEFMNRDQTKVVCSQRTPADRSFRGKVLALLNRITSGRIRLRQPDDAETFWLVELQRDSASLLGSVTQLKGAGSTLYPSPGFDFGYINPTGDAGKPGFHLCDVAHATFAEVPLGGWPAGWWNDRNILIKGTNANFVLYDVVQRTTAPILSQAQIAKAFTEAAITEDPAQANVFIIWNGQENGVYLTDTHKRWLATNSYLFQVQRPDGGLRLVTRQFKFEWSDHFDPARKLYVYSGRETGERSSAVFLRDLAADTNLTLVPDDGAKAFSIPNFQRDGVIFIRSNALWRIDVTGSNLTRLFPPEVRVED